MNQIHNCQYMLIYLVISIDAVNDHWIHDRKMDKELQKPNFIPTV